MIHHAPITASAGTSILPSPSTAARTVTERDHVYGEPEAVVQVVIYGDLASPSSAEAYHAVHDEIFLLRGVRSTFRHRIVHGPSSLVAAGAAEAVAAFGLFWPFIGEVFRAGSEPDALRRHCRHLGLDEKVIAAPLDDARIVRRLDEDDRLATEAGAVNDPTVFINGVRWWAAADATLLEELTRLTEAIRPLWDLDGAIGRAG